MEEKNKGIAALADYGKSETVSSAVRSRRSLRAFLPTSVPVELVERILSVAARAPSSTNMQPWNTYVLTGDARHSLCNSACQAFDDPERTAASEVAYYPERWFEPYLSRRRQIGWQLYGLLGIEKGDRDRTHAQHRRNFLFFDAPVGLIFTIHKELATGSWLDYGMYLQNIMLLAREQGLHTCPQAAWADYHEVIRQHVRISDDEIVVCGMALGYAEPEAIENTLLSERVAASENITFLE